MSFGYIGDTSTSVKQQVKNKGILTTQESFDLERQGFLGGSLELIAEQTHSTNVTTIDFLNIKEDVYDVHLLQFSNIQGDGTSGSDLSIRFYESGVLESASVYQYAFQFGGATGTFGEFNSTSDTSIFSIAGNFQNNIANGYVYFYNLGNSSKYSFCTFQTKTGHPTQSAIMKFGGGVLPQTSVVDGIRLFIDTGENFTAFNFSLFGVKQI